MTITPALPRSFSLACAAALFLASAGGCSSVIGSAYLRDAWLDAVEHAADAAAEARTEAAGRGPSRTTGNTADASADEGREFDGMDAASAEDAPSRRYASLDEAVADADRLLDRTGGLNAAARDTLVAMLESMPKQDWPVVIDEFTASLAAAAPRPAPSVPVEPARVADTPASTPLPSLPPSQPSPAAAEEPVAVVAERVAPTPEQPPAPPALAVQNACFATRVRTWGAVDRFESSRFAPGQEVIVYFELDQLSADESTDGHTTRVDTSLKLVAADGRRIHEWRFEPLEETCRSRRRDYFARYVLAFPDAAPAGPCRLEISVTDAVAGRTAQTTLPLELQAR